ncbi:MAG: thiolase family protein [Mesorhizobium sp.]
MALNRRIAVIGSAISAPVTDDTKSLEELLFDVAQAAMRDAGLSADEIDGIVVASNDQFDGRAISIMAASGSVGGVDRDILSTPSASEHAFVMGVLRVASGQYETQLVVSWSPVEASSLSEAQRLGADPYFHRALPLDELSGAALQASAILAARPEAAGLARRLAERNRANGVNAYPEAAGSKTGASAKSNGRWPIEPDMVSPPVLGAVAVVIASEDHVARHKLNHVAWVRGMGWATEAGFLGDRDLSTAPALEEAARRAYEEAGLTDPRAALGVVELTDVSPYQELLAYDALGLSDKAKWQEDIAAGVFDRDGALPVNPSGGVITINPVFCTGMIRIAEAARQVRGKAGRHQVRNAGAALAHAASGFAMMYQTVLVFGQNKDGALS